MPLTRIQRIALDLELSRLRQRAERDDLGSSLGLSVEEAECLLNDYGTESAASNEQLYASFMKDSPYNPTTKRQALQDRLKELEDHAENVIIKKGTLYTRQPITTDVDGTSILMVDESGPIVDPRSGLSTSYQDLLDLEQTKLDAQLSSCENEIWNILSSN